MAMATRAMLSRSYAITPSIRLCARTFSAEAEPVVNPKTNKVPRKGRSRPRNYARLHLRKDIVRKFVDANKEHEAKASAAGLSWDTRTACIVERAMVVTPETEDWEEEFDELQVTSSPASKSLDRNI